MTRVSFWFGCKQKPSSTSRNLCWTGNTNSSGLLCSILRTQPTDARRRQAIAEWRLRASLDVDMTASVESLAGEIAQKGIKPMDALDVASAITSGADWMLTTDQVLLRKMQTDTRIRVADPVDFIRQIEGGHDET
jgi:hypothetical protein